MANKKGFTLVELLVVIAIIAILSVIGLTVFTGVQANARDARRKSDIDAIAAAIETTKTPGTVYYTSLPATSFSGNKVPSDAAIQYCLKTAASATVLNKPATATWTTACPTATGGDDVGWFTIGGMGFSASAANEVTSNSTDTAAGKFGWQIQSWNVCARLESGVSYCKPSSQ